MRRRRGRFAPSGGLNQSVEPRSAPRRTTDDARRAPRRSWPDAPHRRRTRDLVRARHLPDRLGLRRPDPHPRPPRRRRAGHVRRPAARPPLPRRRRRLARPHGAVHALRRPPPPRGLADRPALARRLPVTRDGPAGRRHGHPARRRHGDHRDRHGHRLPRALGRRPAARGRPAGDDGVRLLARRAARRPRRPRALRPARRRRPLVRGPRARPHRGALARRRRARRSGC